MTANTCPKCGRPLPQQAFGELCPRCLLSAGVEAAGGEFEAASEQAEPSRTAPHREAFQPPTPAQLAEAFPQLEILELLGFGGMGAVYKARQIQLDRIVALKIVRPATASESGFTERFHREARALARLNHENIVSIYDFGEATAPADHAAGPSADTADGKLYYFLMEFVDGADLRQVIKSGELTPQQALAIIPQICEALQYAHEQGVIHRDIKPENVLVNSRGRVKIADFGLAKLAASSELDGTLTGYAQVMGTPRYMAPEQYEGSHHVDHRADIYSLGVVFYELLTGELPIGHFERPSQKAAVSARLDDVVLRALAKEPDRRYQHASELHSDLDSINVDERPPAKPPVTAKPLYQARPKEHSTGSRRRFYFELAVLAACVAGCLSVTLTWEVIRQANERSYWWTYLTGLAAWPGTAAAAAFAVAGVLVLATGSLRPAPLWRGGCIILFGAAAMAFTLMYPMAAARGWDNVTDVDFWRNGSIIAACSAAALMIFGAFAVRQALATYRPADSARPRMLPQYSTAAAIALIAVFLLVPIALIGSGFVYWLSSRPAPQGATLDVADPAEGAPAVNLAIANIVSVGETTDNPSHIYPHKFLDRRYCEQITDAVVAKLGRGPLPLAVKPLSRPLITSNSLAIAFADKMGARTVLRSSIHCVDANLQVMPQDLKGEAKHWVMTAHLLDVKSGRSLFRLSLSRSAPESAEERAAYVTSIASELDKEIRETLASMTE